MTVSPIEIKTMLDKKYFLDRCNQLWVTAGVRKYDV